MSGAKSSPPVSLRLRRALVEAFKQLRIRATIRRVHGPEVPPAQEDGVRVVTVVRNFETLADTFFRHYDRLGVAHYVFIDNGSEDSTEDRIRAHPKTSLFRSHLPFQTYNPSMRRHLLGRYARRHWALQVDSDELFDYPGSSRRSLGELVQYLDSHRYTAVAAQMLDLFPDRPISEGRPFRQEEHCYYDLSAVERIDRGAGATVPPDFDARLMMGGVRSQHFGVRPMLTKHPLLTHYGEVRYPDMHRIRGARLADFHAVLLHFKFAADLRGQAVRAVEEKNYWNDSAEYQGYLDAVTRNPHQNLRAESSRRFENADDLAGPLFLPFGPQYGEWAGLQKAPDPCL